MIWIWLFLWRTHSRMPVCNDACLNFFLPLFSPRNWKTNKFDLFFFLFRFGVRPCTTLSSEWKPQEGEGWEEKDYESEIEKLEKEAEDRLEAKIAEMMSKVEVTGASD